MPSLIGDFVNMRHPDHKNVESTDSLVSDAYVGVEVELENASLRSGIRMWEMHEEGSLKNDGREWVFARPYAGEDVVAAVSNLVSAYEGKQVVCGPDGSVHVHVDVTDLTMDQLFRMLNLSFMFEPLLFDWMSPERGTNQFCQKLGNNSRRASSICNAIATGTTTGDVNGAVVALSNQSYKYSATNTSRLRDLGTVEYRFHRSCCDYDGLIRLINAVCCLKEAARDTRWDAISPHRDVKGRTAASVIMQVFGSVMDVEDCSMFKDALEEGIHTIRQLSLRTRRRIDRREQAGFVDHPPRQGTTAPPRPTWDANPADLFQPVV